MAESKEVKTEDYRPPPFNNENIQKAPNDGQHEKCTDQTANQARQHPASNPPAYSTVNKNQAATYPAAQQTYPPGPQQMNPSGDIFVVMQTESEPQMYEVYPPPSAACAIVFSVLSIFFCCCLGIGATCVAVTATQTNDPDAKKKKISLSYKLAQAAYLIAAIAFIIAICIAFFV